MMRVIAMTIMLATGLFCIVVAGLLLGGYMSGFRIYGVQTGSMQPYIRPGDAVLVQRRWQARTARSGQIITYRSAAEPSVLITHRIQTVTSSTFVTKGDAANQPDAPFERSQIVGRTVARLPGLGGALQRLRHPIALALLIYVPVIVLIAIEIGLMLRASQRRYSYRYARARRV